MEKDNIYDILIQSIMLVASSYQIQTNTLPTYVNVADEICLIYNDAYLMIPQIKDKSLISSKAMSMLKELNKLFDEMSDDKMLWTLEKLKEDNNWEKTRKLSHEILKELNEPYKRPNLDFINWVK